MPNPEIDLMAFGCGSITAPAGCGKTQLITDTLKLHHFAKPVLLLTHTNAGVGALRDTTEVSWRESVYLSCIND